MEAKTTFDFVGGTPTLDFINTEVRMQERPVDFLVDFESLVEWLIEAKLVQREAISTESSAWRDSAEKEDTLQEARQLRQQIRVVIEEIAKGQPVSQEKIELLNQQLQRYAGHLRLEIHADGMQEQFISSAEKPSSLLAPLAKEITSFLSEVDFSLIKGCGQPECVRVFYDTTRNHSRRWCSMDICGNRMKVAAYYDRKRKQK